MKGKYVQRMHLQYTCVRHIGSIFRHMEHRLSFVILPFLLIAGSISGQCDGTRFREFVFPGFIKNANIEYGQNLNFDASQQTLALDIYEPSLDDENLRPLVIFAHGGFFVSGSRDNYDVVPLCEDLARMGYVTASISYRLGFALNNLESRMTEAVLRGTHDMKAAIRWFRKSVAEHGNPYRINPDEIYVGGISAGGYIALHLAYLDEEEELPTTINFANPGLGGGMEGLSGNEGYSSEVKAIISIAGALGDISWIQPGDESAVLFHGNVDTTVPYGYAMQTILGVVPVAMVHGSQSVASALEAQGVSHCFETHEGFNHVPHINSAAIYDTTLSIISNFLSHHICGFELECDYREIAASVSEQEMASIDLFPNPASQRVYVRSSANGPLHFVISDMRGAIIKEGQMAAFGEVGLQELPDGLYLIHLRSGTSQISKKLVIAH